MLRLLTSPEHCRHKQHLHNDKRHCRLAEKAIEMPPPVHPVGCSTTERVHAQSARGRVVSAFQNRGPLNARHLRHHVRRRSAAVPLVSIQSKQYRRLAQSCRQEAAKGLLNTRSNSSSQRSAAVLRAAAGLPFAKRAQVAFEFVVLVSILFAALLVFTSFIRDNFTDVQSDTDYYKLKDVALSVKAEITMAIGLEDGYERGFFVPLTLDGLEYNITQPNGDMMFASEGAEYAVSVPPFTGSVQKGNNVIRKVDGAIEINT